MPLQRRIVRTSTTAPPAPGFIGEGHLAAEVLAADDFALNDPFILLMDDRLDIGDSAVGEPHPHSGFETVTLILEGAIQDRYEGGVLQAGDLQWMTAGRGIVRGESMQAKGKVPLLQLWLTLPRASAGQTRDSRSFASIQYPSAARMVSRFVSTPVDT
jgi:redox-sensitive bicupin YhaK (pirin superfamily)